MTADYVELTNKVYALLVDAFGSASTRALNYWKSVWDITSRPYSPVTVDSVVNENFNRANQLTNLTVDEMRSAGRESAEFAEKLLAEGTKVQDTALGSFRGLIDKYAANVNYVKETTSAQLDDLSRHLEDLEKRTSAVDSSK
jgi:hypothetical protein